MYEVDYILPLDHIFPHTIKIMIVYRISLNSFISFVINESISSEEKILTVFNGIFLSICFESV